ncbi:MAG TPA: XrtA/PEP-CTERM system TPR-repeat protein PrsT [Burkholderiales bacterium]|nr:XrtA/PEP-CTERM system TPR-repeat protein PrsT [Burkholderiales bacterium]
MTSSKFCRTTLLVLAALTAAACSRETPESLVESARAYIAKQDHNAAAIQLRNALQKQPGNAEARYLLGRELLATGDYVSAEKELRRAYELKYPADKVVPALATALVAIGQPKKVLDELASQTVSDPDAIAELQTAIGYAHFAGGNQAAARSAFAAALAARPAYVRAKLGQARLSAVGGDLAAALQLVEQAVAADPKSAESWQLKGDLLAAHQQPDAALEALRKAVELRPQSPAAQAAVVSLLLRQNKLEEAGKQLEAMKKVAPKHPQTAYFDALYQYRNRKLKEAEQAIQQTLSVAPDDPAALTLAATIKLDLGQYAQAEAHAQKVLSRSPDQTLARRVLVATYLRSGQAAKALESLEPGLNASPRDASLHALAGEAHMMNGEAGKAAASFARAAELEPSNSKVRTALALSRLASGDTQKGLTELEQVAAGDSGTRADLALISQYLQQRSYERALAAIAALEKKQPGPLAPHLRGIAFMLKADLATARKSFERALEIDPAYLPSVASLARIDLAEKKPEAARVRYEAIIAKDAKNAAAILSLAELSAVTGKPPAEVGALIEKAVAAQPNNGKARATLVRHYLAHKDTQKALAAAREGMAAVPDNLELMDAAARAYQVNGETNEALSIYKRMTELQPGSPHPYLRMAEAQLAAKQVDAAAGSLKEALAVRPDSLDAQRGLIAVHLSAGRVEEAMKVARQVQRAHPRQAIGYVLEGDIHATRKSWSEAAAAYRAGLKQTGSSTDLAVRLHTVLVAGGDRGGAERFAADWLRTNPRDQAFRMMLAQAALSSKDYAAAVEQYRAILKDQPSNPVVLNNLAWAAAQLKDPHAIEYAEKAYAVAPAHPSVMDTYAGLLIERGETARAVELLRKASAAAPESAEIRLNLVRGLIKAGDKQAARAEIDSLAKLGDKFAGQAELAKLRQQL